MVMDEPTNHLDISSSETLIDALEDYNGTLLFVSHNQSFINRLATKIWDIREAGIVEYPGTLDEYYDHLKRTEKELEPTLVKEGLQDENKIQGSLNTRKNRKAQKRKRAEKRRLIHNTLKPILDELEQLEKRIAELELREKDLGKRLADPKLFKDTKKSVPLISEYNDVKEKLESSLLKWEQCQDKLEAAKKNL
jgi:ATP-binding cassette subfamily F protein 3